MSELLYFFPDICFSIRFIHCSLFFFYWCCFVTFFFVWYLILNEKIVTLASLLIIWGIHVSSYEFFEKKNTILIPDRSETSGNNYAIQFLSKKLSVRWRLYSSICYLFCAGFSNYNLSIKHWCLVNLKRYQKAILIFVDLSSFQF